MSSPYTLREAVPADKPRILPLLAELAPQLDPVKRWAWMYDGNPQGPAITWLAIDEGSGDIAGITSYFPIRLWVEGRVVRAALGGDGYVPPRFRRRGIAAALHRALRAQMPRLGIEVMFGAPAPANRTPLMQSGSRVIGHMVRFVRPLSARAFSPKAAIADPIARVILRPRHGTARLEPIEPADPRIDEVWAATRDELSIATVRDAAFYDWRFRAAPAQVQRAYIAIHEGRPIGTVGLQVVRDKLRIVDLCAPARHFNAIIAAAARTAGDAAALEIAMLRDDAQRRRLWRHGWVAREDRPYLAVAPEDTQAAHVYYDGTRWTYMDADIDVDEFD